MHMHAKILTILYKKLLHKCEFCQAHCVEWFKSINIKFSLSFLNTHTSFYEFWKFETISRIYLNKKEKERLKQCMGRIQPAATVQGSAACHARPADQPAVPWLGGPIQPWRRPTARERDARRTHSRRGHRAVATCAEAGQRG
jgi:hypothetical protein